MKLGLGFFKKKTSISKRESRIMENLKTVETVKDMQRFNCGILCNGLALTCASDQCRLLILRLFLSSQVKPPTTKTPLRAIRSRKNEDSCRTIPAHKRK